MIRYTDIKIFFIRIKNLILDSKTEWHKIKKEDKTNKELIRSFLIPFALLCGTISFLSHIFENEIYASACIFITNIATIFAGVFCSIFILREITSNSEIKDTDCNKMILYSSAVFFLLHSLAYFFEEGSILRAILQLAQFLCIIPVWNGLGIIMKVKPSNKAGYAVLIILLITIIPSIFEKLFSIILDVPIATI
jgi:magnesium-transporting ATPase (P-type)